ncbi:MAG: type II toxin-antitoxin system HicA family toxin [Patescibacteria group bacterium]|nr:type II toxin-antitoxin system HicA family toxin [Patescibacteria group bacterium]
MPKLPVLKSNELVKILNKMGFYKHHQVGSHAQFKHTDKRRTTIPIHSGKDIRAGTLKSILRDIELSTEKFITFLKK